MRQKTVASYEAQTDIRAGELDQPAIEEIIGSVRRLADEELSAPATR